MAIYYFDECNARMKKLLTDKMELTLSRLIFPKYFLYRFSFYVNHEHC